MNILTLNIWGGRAGKECVLEFFERQKDSIDVFCLQEIWKDKYEDLEGVMAGGRPVDHSQLMYRALQDISEVLTEHDAYFRPHYRENYGLCMFVRKGLPILEEGEVFVHEYKGYEPLPEKEIGFHARNVQFVTLEHRGSALTVMNFHGLWNGQGKSDTESRMLQSKRIVEFLRSVGNPYILCGDFNLTPDTESLRKIEQEGLTNLISAYGITSTRTSIYTKPERYADYVFVSPGVEVTNFEVLPDEISDHAPLLLQVI